MRAQAIVCLVVLHYCYAVPLNLAIGPVNISIGGGSPPPAPPAPAPEPGCEGDDWRPTVENWNNLKVDDWLPAWWPCHNGTPNQCTDPNIVKREEEDDLLGVELTSRDGSPPQSLAWNLKTEFAPSVDTFYCNVNTQCTIPSCNDINRNLSDAKQGYWSLLSIANFNEYMRSFYEALDVTQMNQNSLNPVFLQTFSEAGAPSSGGHEVLLEILNAVLIVVGLAFIGFFPELGEFFLAGEFLIKILTGVSKTGGILTGITGAVSLSMTDPDTTDIKELSNLGSFTEKLSQTTRDAVSSATNSLIMGDADPGGYHIWDYLKNGSFVTQAPNPTGNMTSFLMKRYAAGALNSAWKFDRVYILGLWKTSESPCSDITNRYGNGYPQDALYCVDSDDWFYMAYRIPSDDSGFNFPRVQEPRGIDQLGSYGFNMTGIMASSIKAYQADHNMNYSDVRAQQWTGNVNDFIVADADYEGVFTIPICMMPQLSDPPMLNNRMHMSYPCQCGPSTDPGLKGNETDAFKAASGLGGFEAFNKWCDGGKPGAGGTSG